MHRRPLVIVLAAVLIAADAPKPPAIKVTAEKLRDAYRVNEAFADETYSGKEVEVTGKVVRITRSKQPSMHRVGGTDYAVVLTRHKGDMPAVVCFFPGTQRKQLADLAPGQAVTIRGRCRFRMVWSGKPGHSHEEDVSEVWVAECQLVPAARPK